jgi:glycosyltransferase involved in cell wall biosynthesis
MVLLTADTIGGVWSHALELARALGREGIRVTLAAMGRLPTAAQEREAKAVPGLVLYAAPYRLPWMDDPWDDVARAGDWLLTTAAATGCELAHLSEPVFAALDWRVPSLAVGHSCVLSWFRAVRGMPAPPGWDRYRRAMTAGFRRAGTVAAPTRAMLAELARHYGVRSGTVIPNGRDPSRFAPVRKQPVILTAGRLWDPAKNVAALAEAAGGLPWPVLAAGDVRAPAGDAQQMDGLRLLGPLDPDAMADQFARAALYALPARYEPFGQTILEAALAGCALVLGDIASLRELWDGAALFVAPDDPAALRAALALLIHDSSRRESLAARARARAAEYSPHRMVRGYLDLYASLLAGGAHPARPETVPACAS